MRSNEAMRPIAAREFFVVLAAHIVIRYILLSATAARHTSVAAVKSL